MRTAILLTILSLATTSNALAANNADELLKASDVPGGLVVHIGCGDGRLTAALGEDKQFLVQGLDTDEENILNARQHISTAGVYGRVTVDRLAGKQLPYIDRLVNLIILEDRYDLSASEITRVLAPYGVVLLKGDIDTLGNLKGEKLSAPAGWMKVTKPWPAELDEWNHWLHGPGNNAVSSDQGVGISRHLQWMMNPRWGRHHNLLPSVTTMVSARGRVFCIIDEAPIAVKGPTDRWSLVARDAFNGLVIWKKPIPNWGWSKWSDLEFGGLMRFKGPDQLFRRLVATGDRVYITLGFNEPVTALDGATGEVIHTYKGTENTAEILCSGDRLFLARNVIGDRPGKSILAVDTETGKILWETMDYVGITSRGDELKKFTDAYLTVGERNVFFLNQDEVVALDRLTGKEVWKAARPAREKGVLGHYDFEFSNFCTLVYRDDTLFLAQLYPGRANLNTWQQKDMTLRAIDPATGETRWEHIGMSLAHFTPPDLFVNNGMVWTMKKGTVSLLGLDIQSGEVKREYPVKEMLVGHHHRCYRNKATENLYLAGEEGIEYIDFANGELDVHHWLRGACAFGIMPANGLIYLPTHACGCHSNSKLNGFIALASGDSTMTVIEQRLEKGLAYGKRYDSKTDAASTSWPVFRADNRRSGAVDTELPNTPEKLWSQSLDGSLTPPVTAAGCVFLASRNRCEIYCLDAKTGEVRWRRTVDGPVDTPPSYEAGRLVVGTHGGSVYALDAADGELIWRFRAAPADRRLTAFDRIESVWPVHGSVPVIDGRVYIIAGRSMNLDGGLFAYVLDFETGEILQQMNLQANTKVKGEIADAVLPDILVSDNQNVYMRNMRFPIDDIHEYSTTGSGDRLMANDGGLLDRTWLNNTFWKVGNAQAQMLVYDSDTAYGIIAAKKLISKSYGQDIYTTGSGYLIQAVRRSNMKSSKKSDKDRRHGTATTKKPPAKTGNSWQRIIPFRAEALALTDSHLCLAGPPDTADQADPWGAFEDRKGGILEICTKKDGKSTSTFKLKSAPVYDGMAVAEGKIFLSLHDGTVVCYGK